MASSPPFIERDLREEFGVTLAALPAGQPRVDRAKKILFGVKLLGLHSANKHGVDGVDGTDYDLNAIREAAPLYNGIPAYANHPPKPTPGQPAQDRSVYDALGMHHNVRTTDAGLISDLHLVGHHPLTESILDSAENENLNGLYALSHHAFGGGEVRGRRYVITKIQKPFSGDVVFKGSTTRALFESPEQTTMPTMTTLGKIVLESKLPPNGDGLTKALLLEMEDLMGAAVSEEGGDHKDDLVAAIGKLVKSDKPEDHAMAARILKMLKPDCKAEGDAPAKKPEEKAMKESADLSTKILVAVGMKAEGPLLEAMNLSPEINGKLAILATVKAAAAALTPTPPVPAKPGLKPPPGPPRTDAAGRPLTESAPTPAKTCDDLLSVQLT